METYTKPPRTGMEAFEMMPEGTLCQLINDVIVMSPAPTPDHQSIAGIIYEEVSRLVKVEKLGKVFYSPIDVYLNDKNVVQPDIVFVSSSRAHIIDWNKGIIGVPDLIIEILSPGNRKFDLNDKKEVYEVAGVNEYWIVDPKTKWCEGFVLQDDSYKSLGERNAELTIQMFNLSITF